MPLHLRAQGKHSKTFREVMRKLAAERGDKYNALWVDPAINPQVRLSTPVSAGTSVQVTFRILTPLACMFWASPAKGV
jgi:hypothetical protein